jgi:hypothetical protein
MFRWGQWSHGLVASESNETLFYIVIILHKTGNMEEINDDTSGLLARHRQRPRTCCSIVILSIAALYCFCLSSLMMREHVMPDSVFGGDSGELKQPIHNSIASVLLKPYSVFGNSTTTSVVMPGSSSTHPLKQIVKREEQWGVWIGNNWIPPDGWKLYTPKEMRLFYHDKSIFWIGDSTARRAAATMHGILKHANSSSHISVRSINDVSVIDERKSGDIKDELFRRPMPGGEARGGLFLYQRIGCLLHLETFLQDELSGKSNTMESVDTIIVSIGIWEAKSSMECHDPERNANTVQSDVITLLTKLQSRQKMIIWRTSGYHHREKHQFISDLNEHAMDKIEEIVLDQEQKNGTMSNLTFVDWGGAIRPRSFKQERIIGDTEEHYGLEPRYALIQMITNHLSSRQQVVA